MTGDSCMARAVVPRTAAAVDHADTELIGQSGRRISLWCFFIGIFYHFDCRSAANRKVLLHFSFSLEGKCHEVAKGCTRVIMILILHCCSTLGQLRLTWRLYAESPQSGEISSPSSTNHIVAGDLSTRSFNSTDHIYPHNGMQLHSK